MGLLQTSRQAVSGPHIFFALVDKAGVIGGNFWDIPVVLPFPCNTFFLCSVKAGDEANSIVMYLQSLNKPRGFLFTSLNGNEPLFYLNTTNIILAGPVYRGVIRFREAITSFFVAIGSENGELSRYCIGCSNDDELNLRGGIYT